MKSGESAVHNDGGKKLMPYLFNDLLFTGGWLENQYLLFSAVINPNI